MNKLEWCRVNAPEAYKGLSDAELIDEMSATYYSMYRSVDVDCTVDELLDYIYIHLCKLVDINKIMLHGGYLLSKIMPKTSRYTRDIDISINNTSIYKKLIDSLMSIGDLLIDSKVITNYTYKEVDSEECSEVLITTE